MEHFRKENLSRRHDSWFVRSKIDSTFQLLALRHCRHGWFPGRTIKILNLIETFFPTNIRVNGCAKASVPEKARKTTFLFAADTNVFWKYFTVFEIFLLRWDDKSFIIMTTEDERLAILKVINSNKHRKSFVFVLDIKMMACRKVPSLKANVVVSHYAERKLLFSTPGRRWLRLALVKSYEYKD